MEGRVFLKLGCMKKEFHLAVNQDIHHRIMIYKLNNNFKSINALLKYWLDGLEKEEQKDPYSLNYVGDEITPNSENQTYNLG